MTQLEKIQKLSNEFSISYEKASEILELYSWNYTKAKKHFQEDFVVGNKPAATKFNDILDWLINVKIHIFYKTEVKLPILIVFCLILFIPKYLILAFIITSFIGFEYYINGTKNDDKINAVLTKIQALCDKLKLKIKNLFK